jgi:titin
VIAGNYIGIHAGGTTTAGNGGEGLSISLGGTNNLIGGDHPADRNIIGGNTLDGVGIHGSGTNGNKVSGNFIGTDASGTAAKPNLLHGVRIYGDAQNNIVGRYDYGAGNLISGNGLDGVHILGIETSGNTVSGNFIGTDISGSSDLGNGSRGVGIEYASGNTIGPNNLLSGNDEEGVRIIYLNATGNVVYGNNIGTTLNGSGMLENDAEGIFIVNTANNTIGPDNVISGNIGNGICIEDSDDNTVIGNYIGVSASGTAPLGNFSSGVFISEGSINNLIGGDSAAERNVISGNMGHGILLADAGTANNTISGNYIGLGANGSTVMGNEDNGIYITPGVQDNIIGGTTSGQRNVISGNKENGIRITGLGITGNLILGNYIGLGADGVSDRGNNINGIVITAGAQENTIGGDTPGTRNIISGNGDNGIAIADPGTMNNHVLGNYIGTDAGGSVAIGNDHAGVMIRNGAQDNTVGGFTQEERNIISGNEYGVIISDEGSISNDIRGNYIGTTADGQGSLGNDWDGVHLTFGAQENVIGPDNTIAHNFVDGVRIDTPLAFANFVLENSIFDNFEQGIHLTNGANHEILPPTINTSTVIPFSVSGTACNECIVEVFCSQTDDGEGEIWLGRTDTDPSGDFTLSLVSAPYPYLTATASTLVDGTSEFSTVFIAELPDVIFLPTIMR